MHFPCVLLSSATGFATSTYTVCGHLANRVSLGNYYHVLSAATAPHYNPRDFDKIDKMSDINRFY